MRARSGWVFGPLVVGLGHATTGGKVVERCGTWANGLLHSGVCIRLRPWRRSKHASGYLLPGTALILAWRI